MSTTGGVYTQGSTDVRIEKCSYNAMMILFIASVLMWTVCQSCQFSDTFDPCSSENHKPFPYMSDRCPDCDYPSNDRSDLYDLDHDIWYITAFNITTRYVSPYGCGTRIPIWMNGTIPKTEEGVVSRTACVATFDSLCAATYTINVKRCGTATTVYCLVNLPSSIHQRYCFDFDPSDPMSTKASTTPIRSSKTTSVTISLTTFTTKTSSPPSTSTEVKEETGTSGRGDFDPSDPLLTKASTTPIRSSKTTSVTIYLTTFTTKTSSSPSPSNEAKGETGTSGRGENGIQIWVIAVIAGLVAVIAILVAVIIARKRRFSKKKDDNEYEVPEKKYVNDTQSHDYMTLDLPPLSSKEAISAIPNQNEARYVSINDICT